MSLTCSNEIRYNADVKKVSDNCSEKYKSNPTWKSEYKKYMIYSEGR